MTRIGNLPIKLHNSVNVIAEGTVVKVKGQKGELSQDIGNDVFIEIIESKNSKYLHVLTKNTKIEREIKLEISKVEKDKSINEITKEEKISQLKAKIVKDDKPIKSQHGLYRTLLNNMVTGVSEGFTKTLEIVGVGFKSSLYQPDTLELSLGYSHSLYFKVPQEVKVSTETPKGKNPLITLESIDKELLGQVASKIKYLRKVEPYQGKGIRYQNEFVRRKAGKTSSKK